MPKIIVIHGIGNHKPGWTKPFNIHQIFGVPEADVLEISYEGALEKGTVNQYGVPFLTLAAQVAAAYYLSPLVPAGPAIGKVLDYLVDIPAYLGNRQVRHEVEATILSVLSANPGAIVLAHSLGSVAVMRTLQRYGTQCGYPTVILLGSPLSRKMVIQMADLEAKRTDWPVRDLFAIQGKWDTVPGIWPLSGQVKGFGLTDLDNYRIRGGHNLKRYLTAAQEILRGR